MGLETQEGKSLLGHIHMVVGGQNVKSAAEDAALEECATLVLEGLHAERRLTC